ncbi:MAG: hypothetical protein J6T22_02325 [Bacteroidales bacterium]|nr:hypothetical protein [Bacteroidales bacterium]MBP5425582.1 hypothetical protein [Prevotella sp.]
MKTRLFILFLVLSVSLVLCACDAKRRAQRRIRRITEQCPELLSVQAHPIDTFIELPPLADTAVIPLAPLLDGQAVKIQTEQGTFTASATDDSLTVTYEAEPEPVHFSDTLHYQQVVIEAAPEKKKPPAFMWFLLGMVIVLLAVIVIVIVIVIKMVKTS